MPVRSKGLRSKTRGVFRKNPRDRGMPSPNKVLRQYPVGTRVAIVNDSSVQKGMTHKRFQGQTGIVSGKQGESFVVEIVHGKKPKTLVVRAEHLRKIE